MRWRGPPSNSAKLATIVVDSQNGSDHALQRLCDGELIGYLGNPDENGGSAKNPLRPHLHFGIRVGLRMPHDHNQASLSSEECSADYLEVAR